MLNKKPDINIEDIFTVVDGTKCWTFMRSLIKMDDGSMETFNPADKRHIPTRKVEISSNIKNLEDINSDLYLLAADNGSVCHCDIEKAESYIEKGLE